jgi:hypothetical protein
MCITRLQLRRVHTRIFDSPDPRAPDYIGKHPGWAVMELQFYAPGWVKRPPGNSCRPVQWCAALNIDSFAPSVRSLRSAGLYCAAVRMLECPERMLECPESVCYHSL